MPRGLRSSVGAVVLALSLVAATVRGDSDSEEQQRRAVLGTREEPAVLPTFDDIEAVDSGRIPSPARCASTTTTSTSTRTRSPRSRRSSTSRSR